MSYFRILHFVILWPVCNHCCLPVAIYRWPKNICEGKTIIWTVPLVLSTQLQSQTYKILQRDAVNPALFELPSMFSQLPTKDTGAMWQTKYIWSVVCSAGVKSISLDSKCESQCAVPGVIGCKGFQTHSGAEGMCRACWCREHSDQTRGWAGQACLLSISGNNMGSPSGPLSIMSIKAKQSGGEWGGDARHTQTHCCKCLHWLRLHLEAQCLATLFHALHILKKYQLSLK